MKCPTCGTENDPGNRFCDQCGTRLEPSSTAPQVAAALPSAPLACPNCGTPVVPGQAFCDECGATLTMNAPEVSVATSMPTAPAMNVSGTMTTQEPVSTAPSVQVGPVCPVCGHQNLPGDHFCDNCGAALTGDVAAQSTTSSPDAPTIMASAPFGTVVSGDENSVIAVPITTEPSGTSEPPIGEPPTVPAPPKEEPPTPTPAPEDEPPTNQPPLIEPPSGEPPIGEPPAQQLQVDSLALAVDSTPLAADVAVAPAPDIAAQETYAADQQRLNDEIARQQQIITQFEQMQTMFGAATPLAVTQGLSEARDALSKSQSELDSLPPPAPAVDPAEVARLNDEIARQQQIITQFEQMQTMFGAATPPAVTQGLDAARSALTSAQDELAALGGAVSTPAISFAPAPTSPSVSPESSPLSPAANAPATSPAADDEFSAPTVLAAPQQTLPAPTTTTAETPAPQSTRFVLEDGRELNIPQNKAEVIIGREDPISGIYPEIDLTNYGGESGGVSRQHAKLYHANGDWTVTDLNSTNYTRVDGARVEPNQPITLKDGVRVQFGRVAMTFHA